MEGSADERGIDFTLLSHTDKHWGSIEVTAVRLSNALLLEQSWDGIEMRNSAGFGSNLFKLVAHSKGNSENEELEP